MPSMLEIDLDKCTGCGDCVEKCPTQAVELVSGKPSVVRPDECDYCIECEIFCIPGAISCSFEIILADPGDIPKID
ncbi:MAG: 4Fe-4S binding protein [Dehalococcoidales bacterium]|nr:4Fe-4S binding protein [Dehalococcoidales bacterium]MDP6737631.1 4Fe-4S binding protein [Dehalococcoidales bacterium]